MTFRSFVRPLFVALSLAFATTAAASAFADNTGDDASAIETTRFPGPDGLLGTSDDRQVALDGFTREILIRDVPNEGGQLRSIVVTISYRAGSMPQTYTLVTYISSYA